MVRKSASSGGLVFDPFAGSGSTRLLAKPQAVVQITGKGQVTIPQEIRNRPGLLPHTSVEFELAGNHAGREELLALSTPWGLEDRAAASFLNWCSCCDWRFGPAHPRCRPISQLFSEGRDTRSY